ASASNAPADLSFAAHWRSISCTHMPNARPTFIEFLTPTHGSCTVATHAASRSGQMVLNFMEYMRTTYPALSQQHFNETIVASDD
ncbi:hypothetical protein T492DRAFT_860392, partial [Pavlovales sp. CCMP2436]